MMEFLILQIRTSSQWEWDQCGPASPLLLGHSYPTNSSHYPTSPPNPSTPMVMAVPDDGQFPDISFKLFSQFVKENFSSRITLSQVLLVLFTITDNHDLLNLHAWQQNPRFNGENHSSNSGWLKCLARALQEKLEEDNTMLFKSHQKNQLSEKEKVDSVTQKLDGLAKLLNLYPYNSDGEFQGKLKAVPYKSIKGLWIWWQLFEF